jgi:hypothetical protein
LLTVLFPFKREEMDVNGRQWRRPNCGGGTRHLSQVLTYFSERLWLSVTSTSTGRIRTVFINEEMIIERMQRCCHRETTYSSGKQ